jgi:hypothetical protein
VPSLLVSAAMLASLTGCALTERLNDRPALNKEYVPILVKVYGVPYLDEYLEREVGEAEAQKYGKIEVIAATGRWKSTYKGDGLWQVEGTIVTKNWGDCSTTWTLDESDGRIRIIEFTCD